MALGTRKGRPSTWGQHPEFPRTSLLVPLHRIDTHMSTLHVFIQSEVFHISFLLYNIAFSTMNDRIGITVFWILGPIILVACVSFVILKLLTPAHRKQSKPVRVKQPSRRQKTSITVADSWPDLERHTPDSRIPIEAAQVHNPCRSVQSPLPAWKPSRQSLLDWSFTSPPDPSHPRC